MPIQNCETNVLIPGKNYMLSLAELAAFLEARRAKFEIGITSREFFIVNIYENAEELDIADFGGTIKIGKASKSLPTDLMKATFLEKNKESRNKVDQEIKSGDIITGMLEKATGKYSFGVSVYNAEETLRPISKVIQRHVGSVVKQELREHGVKSGFMGFSRDRQLPQLTHVEVLKTKLVEKKAEVLICIGRQHTWLATTTGVHDPFEFQKRDIEKPRQRKIFAMPPRLAKIMVNLSFCTAGKILLDPFCGVGTILQEALLAKAKVVGLDLNPWCVEAANTNLEWLVTEYGLEEAEYRVLRGDALSLAKKIGYGVDCIVTEPDLGPALRDVPTTPYALKIVEKLEPLFFRFLEEAHKVLVNEGRLVLVTPYFRTRSGKPVRMAMEKTAEDMGFRRVYPFRREFFSEENKKIDSLVAARSLWEIGEKHKVGREIHIFQK
jgi:tRNA G10  N-methylase Trm11